MTWYLIHEVVFPKYYSPEFELRPLSSIQGNCISQQSTKRRQHIIIYFKQEGNLHITRIVTLSLPNFSHETDQSLMQDSN